MQETLSLLKEIKGTKDIKTILGVEEILLRQELAVYANSPEESSSLKKAVDQLQEAKNSFSVVQDTQGYQSATKTYSSKQKEAGLPGE